MRVEHLDGENGLFRSVAFFTPDAWLRNALVRRAKHGTAQRRSEGIDPATTIGVVVGH